MRFESLVRQFVKKEARVAHTTASRSSNSSSSPSPREVDEDEIEQLGEEVAPLYVVDENAVQRFQLTDRLDELKMRQSNMLNGNRLFYQPAWVLSRSLSLLQGVSVSIQGESVAQTNDLVEALLRAIHAKLGISCGSDYDVRAALLTAVDVTESEKMEGLKICIGGQLVPHNRDLLVLKLISRESAHLVMLPVGVQIQNYSDEHARGYSLRPLIQEQWTAVNIVKTDVGLTAVGYGSAAILVQERERAPYTAATVRVDGQVCFNEQSGELLVQIARSQLKYDSQTPLAIQNQIYHALNSHITYDTVLKMGNQLI
jgi:hypothetical protein